MNIKKNLQLILGILCISVSLITWALDLSNLVGICIYCRTERSVIGLMGLLFLLPIRYFNQTRYFLYPLAFLGAHVAAAQIFLHFQHENIMKISFPLASCALLLIVGSLILIQDLSHQALDVHKTNKLKTHKEPLSSVVETSDT